MTTVAGIVAGVLIVLGMAVVGFFVLGSIVLITFGSSK